MMDKGLKTEIPQIKTDEICENISDNIISITESKAKLVYRKYTGSPTRSVIVSNLSLAAAFAIPIITADFKDIVGISSDIIKTAFVFVSAIFIFKFIYSLSIFLKEGRFLNEKNFIRELKGQENVKNILKQRKELEKQKKRIEKKILYRNHH